MTISDFDSDGAVIKANVAARAKLTQMIRACNPDVQTFTSGGTWNMPANASHIEIAMIGCGADGTNGGANGGAGGGSGAFVRETLPADMLPSVLTVVCGVGSNSTVSGGSFALSAPGAAAGGQGGGYSLSSSAGSGYETAAGTGAIDSGMRTGRLGAGGGAGGISSPGNNGGAGVGGVGGAGGPANTPGQPGAGYGAGGGGGRSTTGGGGGGAGGWGGGSVAQPGFAATGGTGAGGKVVITTRFAP